MNLALIDVAKLVHPTPKRAKLPNIQRIQEGGDHFVWLIDDDLVIRPAKDERVGNSHRREVLPRELFSILRIAKSFCDASHPDIGMSISSPSA